jgi:hypothetical protein
MRETSRQQLASARAFDEVRQFFRVRTTVKQKVSLSQQREVFRQRLDILKTLALVV